MRKPTKFASVGAAAVTTALLLAACSGGGGSSAAGKVTWTTWGTPDELKAFDAVNAQFKEENKDINLVFQPTASYC